MSVPSLRGYILLLCICFMCANNVHFLYCIVTVGMTASYIFFYKLIIFSLVDRHVNSSILTLPDFLPCNCLFPNYFIINNNRMEMYDAASMFVLS